MSVIAIITARGGSKRIPRKNIKEFCGKPIIAYSIEAALNSGIFSRVIVSTDDEDIKRISESYGAEVPFFRSKKNSDDFATTVDVLKEVIALLPEYDTFCCLYPTAPFVTSVILKDSHDKFLKGNDSSFLIPVSEFSYPIQRALIIKDDKLVYRELEYRNTRSQDIVKAFHDVGQFYWGKCEDLLNINNFFDLHVAHYVIDTRFVQDIDTLEDWDIAEFKFRYLNEKNII